MDPSGEVVFYAKHVGAVLDFLEANDIDTFRVVADLATRRVRMSRILETKEA